MKIKYVSRKKLYPAFGESDMKNQVAFVREDLPKIVKKFVRDHELYHLKDKSQNVLWREIKANIYSAIRHPLGSIITLIMSLQPYRIKLYIQRIKKGK